MTENMRRCLAVLFVLMVGTIVVVPGASAAEDRVYRTVLEEHSDAIVTVSFTLEMKFQSRRGQGTQTRETSQKVNGVMVHPSGIVAVTATQLDGSVGIRKKMMGGSSRMSVEGVSDFSVRFPDGTRKDAEVLARDPNRDLAFVEITEDLDGTTVDAVPLDGSEASPSVGQEVVLVNRFTKELNYQPQFYNTRINASIEQPRRLYSLKNPQSILAGFLSSPVFTTSGELLGFVTFRTFPSSQSGIGGGPSRGGNRMARSNRVNPFILPVSELRQSLSEARGNGE
jgi:S1-C subfamily serine protease